MARESSPCIHVHNSAYHAWPAMPRVLSARMHVNAWVAEAPYRWQDPALCTLSDMEILPSFTPIMILEPADLTDFCPLPYLKYKVD